jgi:hypothetical protein
VRRGDTAASHVAALLVHNTCARRVDVDGADGSDGIPGSVGSPPVIGFGIHDA